MSRQITEELFLELGELLNSNLDEVTILRTFCNRVLSLFDAERVSILALDAQGQHLSLTAWAGRYPEDMQGIKVSVGHGVSGWVAATGEPLLVRDVDQDERFDSQAHGRYRTRSFLSVPLKSRGRLLGVINVTDTNMNQGFTDENLRTLKALAHQVGMGMENFSQRSKLIANYNSTSALISALQELQSDAADIESSLIPGAVRALNIALGPYSHLILIGEMGSNRAWASTLGSEGGINMSVMDFRSGYSLYQSMASLTLHPPYPENKRLLELGFAWDMIRDSRLRLVRSLLPPRPDLFGLVMSGIPEGSPELLEISRMHQAVLTQYTGLLLAGIFNRIQIEKLDQLKTELISTVSHELRTPLTSIQGFSDYLLRMDNVPDQLERYLQIIKNESMRLNRLINDFLDLARLESGQLSLIKEPFDPLAVVENAVQLLKPQAEAGRAMVRLHCDRNLPNLIADQDRIEQALVNLIGNAIKYGGKGVHIDIALSAVDGHTIFEVTDDGPGISRDEIPLVFNRFYRGVRDEEKDDSREKKGTGLGLSLTKEIIEQHGGTISAQSTPDKKTSFRLSLPSHGLISPQRGISAWHPGEEEFTNELANRIAEGKTVGVLTVHVNAGPGWKEADELFSVEALGEIEEILLQTLSGGGLEDNFIQSRPQGEFIILTYASLVDGYADSLLSTFAQEFGEDYALAVGAAVSTPGESATPEKIMTLSLQACQYVENTEKQGYLKNRRM